MRHSFKALVFQQNGKKFYIAIADRKTLPSEATTDPYGLQNERGYQRVLNLKRVADYSGYIDDNWSPRTILLNVRLPLRVTEKGKGRVVTITVPDKVYNVDGQHFSKAISLRKQSSIFESPVIFSNLTQDEESLLFRVMNVTAEKLSTDVKQQVNARHQHLLESLPRSMANRVEIERPATLVVNALFQNPNSLWYDKITLAMMPHDNTRRFIKQASFVNSLAQYVFKYNRDLSPDEAEKIVNALWDGAKLAWGKCVDDPQIYVLVGMMGVGVLHRILGRLLPKLRGSQWVADKIAYRDILLASGITYQDWAKGNPEARIGYQLGTNRAVYENALQLMLKGIEKNWPKNLPAFKPPKLKKLKVAVAKKKMPLVGIVRGTPRVIDDRPIVVLKTKKAAAKRS